MRRLAQAVGLVVSTLAFVQFEVDGQKRVGIPRPRQNQPIQPVMPAATPAPSEDSAHGAGQAAPAAQTYRPAVEYTVVAKVNGKPFKSYTAEVRGGRLRRHPRNSLGAEPHRAFIPPRLVDTSARTGSRYATRDACRVTRKQ